MNPKDFKTVLDPILYEDFDYILEVGLLSLENQ